MARIPTELSCGVLSENCVAKGRVHPCQDEGSLPAQPNANGVHQVIELGRGQSKQGQAQQQVGRGVAGESGATCQEDT